MAFATAEEYKNMAGNFIHDIINEDLASGKPSRFASTSAQRSSTADAAISDMTTPTLQRKTSNS